MFNPPPNWPAPPQGWQPPPDWQPDAAWGPAPEGWRLFVNADRYPWLRSFGIAVGLFLVVAVPAQAAYDLTAYGLGQLFAPFLLAATITALILRSRSTRWPTWQVVGTVAAIAMAFGVVSAVGNADDEGSEDTGLPLRASARAAAS